MSKLLISILLFVLTTVSTFAQAPAVELELGQPQLDAQRDFVGKVLNYAYHGSAGLRVIFHEDSVNWEGVSGPLNGLRGNGQGLRLSKIDEGIYFTTWVTSLGGQDSIVFNLNDMNVFVHVYTGDAESTFQLDGVISCFGDESECIAPDLRPQSTEERQQIMRNRGTQ